METELLVCAICGAEGKVILDHDHASGSVRGWICSRCNVMLGYAADSQDRLRNAADYLARAAERPRRIKKDRPGTLASRAEYMRAYRARKKIESATLLELGGLKPGQPILMRVDGHWQFTKDRIAELEEEVRHLKAELAKRTLEREFGPTGGFNTRPFTPVPKRHATPPTR